MRTADVETMNSLASKNRSSESEARMHGAMLLLRKYGVIGFDEAPRPRTGLCDPVAFHPGNPGFFLYFDLPRSETQKAFSKVPLVYEPVSSSHLILGWLRSWFVRPVRAGRRGRV